jgi:hypothetical protein
MPIPPSTSSGTLTPDKPIGPKTADDINDMFNEIDVEGAAKPEKKEPKEKEEPEEKEPEEKENEDDDELELKEPEEGEEKLDLSRGEEFDAPPRKGEILKEYPELFKKFPFLEKMMYRDKQYSELFGSYDDAKEVAEKSEIFNSFEQQLLSGNTADILREVKETDQKAFDTIVDDYLPTLHKVDKEAYFHVVGNMNKRLIMEMVEEANTTNNDDLKQAALLVNQFVFGTSKFTAPQNRVAKVEDSAKKEVEAERLSYVRERFESTRDDLQSQVDNTLRATISEYIDPRGVMSGYVKKNAVADAMKILSSSIAADPSVAKNLDKLWRAVFSSNFNRESTSKVKSYYLSKAKGQLKNAILKARAEALKDATPSRKDREDEKENEEETPSSRNTRKIIATGRPSHTTGKNQMKKGESVAEFFARD